MRPVTNEDYIHDLVEATERLQDLQEGPRLQALGRMIATRTDPRAAFLLKHKGGLVTRIQGKLTPEQRAKIRERKLERESGEKSPYKVLQGAGL